MTEVTVVEIPASLLEQQATLTKTIATIDAELETLATKRHDAEQNVARINRAVAYLRGEIIPIERPAGGSGTRRPMSQAGKDAIRAGLLASAARKREAAATAAASAASPAAQIVPDASVSTPAPVPPAETKAAKKRAGK